MSKKPGKKLKYLKVPTIKIKTPSNANVEATEVETKPQITHQIIKCDNEVCKHRKLDRCRAPEVELVKTWMGSEKYYKLVCRTASDYSDPNK